MVFSLYATHPGLFPVISYSSPSTTKSDSLVQNQVSPLNTAKSSPKIQNQSDKVSTLYDNLNWFKRILLTMCTGFFNEYLLKHLPDLLTIYSWFLLFSSHYCQSYLVVYSFYPFFFLALGNCTLSAELFKKLFELNLRNMLP